MKRVLLSVMTIVAAGFSVTAQAADMAVTPETSEAGQHVSVFTGVDFTSIGSYTGFAGATIAPVGKLDESGLRIGLFGAAGSYKYDTTIEGPTTVKGTFAVGDVLLGYGVAHDNWNAKFYAGLSIQDHSLSPVDPNNPVQGAKAGLKVQGDIWINPTAQTMVLGLASFSTVFNSYYATVKTGYDVFGKQIFIGPEAIAQGNDRYAQLGVGAHISGIKLGKNAELGFSAGYLQSSDVGSGAYAQANLRFGF